MGQADHDLRTLAPPDQGGQPLGQGVPEVDAAGSADDAVDHEPATGARLPWQLGPGTRQHEHAVTGPDHRGQAAQQRAGHRLVPAELRADAGRVDGDDHPRAERVVVSAGEGRRLGDHRSFRGLSQTSRQVPPGHPDALDRCPVGPDASPTAAASTGLPEHCCTTSRPPSCAANECPGAHLRHVLAVTTGRARPCFYDVILAGLPFTGGCLGSEAYVVRSAFADPGATFVSTPLDPAPIDLGQRRRSRRRLWLPAAFVGARPAAGRLAHGRVSLRIQRRRAVNDNLRRQPVMPREAPAGGPSRDRASHRPPAGATAAMNYVLIGADDPAGGSSRSDALMVLHLAADRRSAYLISFPRDLWVPIPGYGRNKIKRPTRSAVPSSPSRPWKDCWTCGWITSPRSTWMALSA